MTKASAIANTERDREAKRIVVGGQVGKVYPPRQMGASWVVTIEDALGDQVEKRFPSKSRALDFYTALFLAKSETEMRADVLADAGVSAGRQTETSPNHVHLHEVQTKSHSMADWRAQRGGVKGGGPGVNLRKVSEVLASYGLDPTVEIAEILQPVVVVDPDTGVEMVEHRLDADARSRLLLELMQYAHPKLKSVEMKVEGTLGEMTQAQIDAKLQALLAKAMQREAKSE